MGKILQKCISSAPLLSSVLARIQFISLWSVANHRSDFAHLPISFCNCDMVRRFSFPLIKPGNSAGSGFHNVESEQSLFSMNQSTNWGGGDCLEIFKM